MDWQYIIYLYMLVVLCRDVAGCRTHSRAVNATMVANSARARGGVQGCTIVTPCDDRLIEHA